MTIGMLLGPKHAHDDVATVHEKRLEGFEMGVLCELVAYQQDAAYP